MIMRFLAALMTLGICANNIYYSDAIEVSVVTEVELTKEQLDSAKEIVEMRIDRLGLTEAVVGVKNGKIYIALPPEMEKTDELIAELTKTPKLEFVDTDGNVLLDGSDRFVKSASATFGVATEYGFYEHYVTLWFTPEGQATFKAATEKAVEKISTDENYILITIDGEVYSSPSVNEVIDSDSCIITGAFDKETAKELADVINADDLALEIVVE